MQKRRKRRPSRPRRHSWSLRFRLNDPEVLALSREARDGLEYAQSLARNARARSLAGFHGELLPERVTPAELGAPWDGPIQVYTKIKQARIELFGKDLSDSGIYYRLKQRPERLGRVCAEPGCKTPIPPQAHGRTRYCQEHKTGAARTRRHRRNIASDLPAQAGSAG